MSDNVISTNIITKTKTLLLQIGFMNIIFHKIFVVSENIILFYGKDLRLYDANRKKYLLKSKHHIGLPKCVIGNKYVVLKFGRTRNNTTLIGLLDLNTRKIIDKYLSKPIDNIINILYRNESQLIFITGFEGYDTQNIKDANKRTIIIYDYVNDKCIDESEVYLNENSDNYFYYGAYLLNENTILFTAPGFFHLYDIKGRQIVLSYKDNDYFPGKIFEPLLINLSQYSILPMQEKIQKNWKILLINYNRRNLLYESEFYTAIMYSYKEFLQEKQGAIYPLLDYRIFLVTSRDDYYVIDTKKCICIHKEIGGQGFIDNYYYTSSFFVGREKLNYHIYKINKEILQCYLDGTLEKKGELYCKTVVPVSNFFTSLFKK